VREQDNGPQGHKESRGGSVIRNQPKVVLKSSFVLKDMTHSYADGPFLMAASYVQLKRYDNIKSRI